MPYYVVRLREVATHEFIVLARNKGEVERLDTDIFADLCSKNTGFFSLDERVIESVERTDTCLPDDVHLDVRAD
jgi:hypothetical protein